MGDTKFDFILRENCLDYDTYFSLRESVGWKNFGEAQTKKALANTYYSLVAECDNKIVAMGRVVGDGLYFTIADVIVSPAYQGNSIGATIIQKILNHLESEMVEGARISIQLISEIGKEEFYIKQGFKLIPHEYCGPALRKILIK